MATILARGRRRRAARRSLLDLARALDLDAEARQAVLDEVAPALTEHSVGELADALRAGADLSPGRLAAHLATRVESELARGETLLAAGWVLSRTEARLLLLSALVNRPQGPEVQKVLDP
jgi:hypothetical protein